MANVLVRADIPVLDMERAMSFYGKVLQVEFVQPFPGQPVAVPPQDMGPVAFDLVAGQNVRPGSDGPRIYLSAMDDIHGMAKRIEEAGGRIVQTADRHGRDGGHHLLLHRFGGEPDRHPATGQTAVEVA